MKGYRSIIIGLILALTTYAESDQVASFLHANPGQGSALLLAVIAGLRVITTTPIFTSILQGDDLKKAEDVAAKKPDDTAK